ncbi:hypothetical protein CDAR_259141 [Caerostris darwini]|uniref:Uncharacterized protein n=1 Tax=Caerostris darwini TaxID=1538125 RepID=A0AAV4PQF1_9ARAC|nr:hypothetical protein CDAR_259141 [Caerostris darwini]
MKNKRSLESPDVARKCPPIWRTLVTTKMLHLKDEIIFHRKCKFKEENSANAIENIFLPPAETNLSMNNAGASGAIGSTDDLLPAISVERPRDPRNKKYLDERSRKWKWKNLIQNVKQNITSDWV